MAQVHCISWPSIEPIMRRFLLLLVASGCLLGVAACSSEKERGQFRDKDRPRAEDKDKDKEKEK